LNGFTLQYPAFDLITPAMQSNTSSSIVHNGRSKKKQKAKLTYYPKQLLQCGS